MVYVHVINITITLYGYFWLSKVIIRQILHLVWIKLQPVHLHSMTLARLDFHCLQN